MSLFSLLLALAPVAAAAAPPPDPGQAPTIEQRRERHRELRERVGQRLRVLRTVELANALSLSEPQALKLSAEMQKFDDRREPLREKLREARWTVADAARGDAAIADATDARKQLAALDLEEYRALAKLVPADQQPRLARFLLQFPAQVQRLVQEARHGMGRGRGPGAGLAPGGRPGVPGPRPGPGFGPGPGEGLGPGMGPGPGAGPDGDDLDEPFEP